MAEEWFWKHKGQMLGPLSTETLADLVQDWIEGKMRELRGG